MTNIYFLDLGNGYQLAGFADFEAAFEATDTIYKSGFKIAYLNEVTHISESEVLPYARQYEKADSVMFRNYLTSAEDLFTNSATESIRTALAALEALNNFKAKYIAVLLPKHSKVSNLQRW